MDNVKPKVIFEHPLNEKMRTWLRIEFLLKQLNNNNVVDQNNALLFFHSLSELLEIIERNDIRGDLIKELDEQKAKLTTWLNVKGVDITLLNNLLEKINAILSDLISHPKLGQSLKEDRFICSIRKRLAIPGGCCSFDLPFFHLWLQLPQDARDQQIALWSNSFITVTNALSIYMQLTRQSAIFKPFSCINNFYQSNSESISMIRIQLPLELNVFPQVSGNASRYTIRFVPLDLPNMNTKMDNTAVDFELACC